MKIDLEVLADLTDADLRELGIPLGLRKKLLKAISALTAETELPFAREAKRPEAESRQLTVMFVRSGGLNRAVGAPRPRRHGRSHPGVSGLLLRGDRALDPSLPKVQTALSRISIEWASVRKADPGLPPLAALQFAPSRCTGAVLAAIEAADDARRVRRWRAGPRR